MGTSNPGVCKHDVQPSVTLESIVHDLLDGGLVRSVELAGVYLAARVEGLHLPLVVVEEFVVKVADVDSFGTVLGELVRCCPAYAQGRVGA